MPRRHSQIEGRFQHQRGDLDHAAEAARAETRAVEAQLAAQRQMLADMQVDPGEHRKPR